MNEIAMNISVPLDDDGFFRRECPFCQREFKILLEKKDLTQITQMGIDSFMVESEEEIDLEDSSFLEPDFNCPYCGQWASSDSWWTQEQLAFIGIIAKNIAAKIVNDNLIKPLKKEFGSSTSRIISFEGQEMKQQELWISPEINDMSIFDLPCCQRKIKVIDDWTSGINCYFCGFPYEKKRSPIE